MKFIGILFGARLFLETEDPRVVKQASDFLMRNCMPKMPTDDEIKKEVETALGIRKKGFVERLLMEIFPL